MEHFKNNKKVKIHVKNNHWAPGFFPTDAEGEKNFTITREHLDQALKNFPKPSKLNQILLEDFQQLKQTRIQLDSLISEWLHTNATETDFQQNLTYKNSKGEASTRNFGELLHHLFNHQTHHRGQVSVLLSQKGIDVGVTDFLIDIVDRSAST